MQDVPSRLQEHKVVPFWTLPDIEGTTFNLAKRRGRAHFILLVCGPDADPAPFLKQLAPHMSDLRTLPAQALVVVPSEERAADLRSLPCTILVDAARRVRDRYLPAEASAGLFILDRYGALYHQWLVTDTADLPAIPEVVEWITAVGMQCSV